MKFRPSQVYIDTLSESDDDELLGDKVEKLVQDFQEVIEELPTHKAKIASAPREQRQNLVDFAFAFFIGGASCVLDEFSNYNNDNETRGDLQ